MSDPGGLLGTLIERLTHYASTVEFKLTTYKAGVPDVMGGWFPKMAEDVKGEWIRAYELEAALATLPSVYTAVGVCIDHAALPPAPPQAQEGLKILAGHIVEAIDNLPQDYNHSWQERAVPLVQKLLAQEPFGARLKRLRDELYADAEREGTDREGSQRLAHESQDLADHIDRFVSPKPFAAPAQEQDV